MAQIPNKVKLLFEYSEFILHDSNISTVFYCDDTVENSK